MKQTTFGISAAAGIVTLLIYPADAAVVTFDGITLPGSGYLNSSSPAGGFAVQGTTFRNEYDSTSGSWSGFAISNQVDTTIGGFGNQYSAFTGIGEGASSNYAVFYATYDADPHLSFASLTNMAGKGASFTNTTYAALDMRAGSGFSKNFGGLTGNDADWFKLTIDGFAAGSLTNSIDFYLADFSFANPLQDYILDDWTYVDFTALGTVDQIRFSLSSSDNSVYGGISYMNTPAYFAMDTIAVPEPSALLCSLAGLGLALRRKR